jgi:predicted nucleic acid-binding protein
VTAVIDASALVAYCLKEEGLDRQKIKEHLQSGVLAVDLIKAESTNAVLVARRRGTIDDKGAKSASESMLDLCMNNIQVLPEDDALISEAFDVAKSNNVTIYDLLYLLIAKKTKSVLLSKDDNQISLGKKLGISSDNI